VNRLADTLEGRAGWRVDFIRTGGPGRPKAGSDKILADNRLKTKVWEEQSRGFKKKEAAVEGLKRKTGKGRSTLYRAISRKRSS